MTRGPIRVRRVYEEAESDDGFRVLVDRVWPRGLSKDSVRADDWEKRVAPSTSLRRWFGHGPDRFAEFCSRYHDELDAPSAREALDHLRRQAEHGPLTLLTATKDIAHSHVTVLADHLRDTS